MQIKMEQPLALVRDLVYTGVQLRKGARVPGDLPGAPAKVGEHRRPIDELEHEPVLEHVEDLRHANALRPRVLHDGRLARGFPMPLETAEDAAVTEVEDLRGAPDGDGSQLRS